MTETKVTDTKEPQTTAKPKKATTAKAAAKPKAAAAAKKTGTAKTTTVKKSATKKTKATTADLEQRYRMIEVAAYYIAEKDGFAGSPVDYWIAAELQIGN